jgi:hypothetical protein
MASFLAQNQYCVIDGHRTGLTHIETQLDSIHLDRHPN